MSETTKEEKANILAAIALLEDAFNKEIEYENKLTDEAQTPEGKAFHAERMTEYNCGKTGMLKLKAKMLLKNG